METYDFTTAFARVFECAECRTQTQLAHFLGIRQSSISDAKRRERIPSDWLFKLLRRNRSNPEWVLTGQGARYLMPANGDCTMDHLTESRPLRECSTLELLNELVRRSCSENRFHP